MSDSVLKGGACLPHYALIAGLLLGAHLRQLIGCKKHAAVYLALLSLTWQGHARTSHLHFP